MIASLLLTAALSSAAQEPPAPPPTVGGQGCCFCQEIRKGRICGVVDIVPPGPIAGAAPSTPAMPGVPPAPLPPGSVPRQPPVVIANDAFVATLFQQLRSGSGNLFVSPWSVQSALGMALAGADGQTAAQLEQLLGVRRGDAAERARRARQQLSPPRMTVRDAAPGQEPRPNYELDLVNAAWIQDGLELRTAYETQLRQGFDAALARADFRDAAAAAAAINAWAAERTDGRIDRLIRPGTIDADTQLVLVNAIRFQADWARAFPERKTEDAPFTTAAGELHQVPMMHRLGEYAYGETEELQVVRLDYRGGQVAMFVLLPKDPAGLPALEAGVNAEMLRHLPRFVQPATVDLRLPRFRIDRQLRLDGALRGAGVVDPFDAQRADFSGISEQPLFVSAVLHQAGITVDEQGTEASAATSVHLAKLGYVEADAVFTADHPFLFLIRHQATGAVLFLGRVEDPLAG